MSANETHFLSHELRAWFCVMYTQLSNKIASNTNKWCRSYRFLFDLGPEALNIKTNMHRDNLEINKRVKVAQAIPENPRLQCGAILLLLFY